MLPTIIAEREDRLDHSTGSTPLMLFELKSIKVKFLRRGRVSLIQLAGSVPVAPVDLSCIVMIVELSELHVMPCQRQASKVVFHPS